MKKGEHWWINGNNASGKSAFCKAVAGQYFIREGKVEYHFLKQEIEAGHSFFDLRRKYIYLLSFSDHHKLLNPQQHFYQQRFHSFEAESLTVEQYLTKVGFKKEEEWSKKLINLFQLEPLLPLATIQLSSGQMRKLLLTTALFRQPQLLIIDNPYIGLDPKSRNQFNQILDEVVDQFEIQLMLAGHAIELPKCITHQLTFHEPACSAVTSRAGRSVIIKNERFESYPKATQINSNKTITLTQNSKEAIQKFKNFYQTATWKKDHPHIINLQNIKIQYAEKTIFESIDWTVKQGEKWALIGNNGSGKSTILGIIAGDHPQAYANQVEVFGEARGMGNNIWDMRKRIGFISPELHAYFPYDFTGYHIVASGLMDGYFINRKITTAEQEQIVWLFDYFEQRGIINKAYRKLSTGEQRLLFFMRALIKNPPLLLLDEPFQGIDAPTIEKAKHLLDEILTAYHTLIFITHFISEIPTSVKFHFNLNKAIS